MQIWVRYGYLSFRAGWLITCVPTYYHSCVAVPRWRIEFPQQLRIINQWMMDGCDEDEDVE